MPMSETHVAALRGAVRAYDLRGFLRLDDSGRGLLVSDAPRHEQKERIQALAADERFVCACHRDLLYIDLPPNVYQALLTEQFDREGAFKEAYCEWQCTLQLLLMRKPRGQMAVDIVWARNAMLACARGERAVQAFLKKLLVYDAQCLRKGETHTVRVCALLCARFFDIEKGIGVPAGAEKGMPFPLR